jgi:hypothetical protein
MPFGHDVVAEAEYIGIFVILINTLYLKKKPSHLQANRIRVICLTIKTGLVNPYH